MATSPLPQATGAQLEGEQAYLALLHGQNDFVQYALLLATDWALRGHS